MAVLSFATITDSAAANPAAIMAVHSSSASMAARGRVMRKTTLAPIRATDTASAPATPAGSAASVAAQISSSASPQKEMAHPLLLRLCVSEALALFEMRSLRPARTSSSSSEESAAGRRTSCDADRMAAVTLVDFLSSQGLAMIHVVSFSSRRVLPLHSARGGAFITCCCTPSGTSMAAGPLAAAIARRSEVATATADARRAACAEA
mmetsp:Transcript_69965/g.192048  ORF Transcript_69965/g.192048 Transcript_69965/m.192048 type:complete len:207 (-) Transcript_69965:70-690(-)